jgi:hypothetical protein
MGIPPPTAAYPAQQQGTAIPGYGPSGLDSYQQQHRNQSGNDGSLGIGGGGMGADGGWSGAQGQNVWDSAKKWASATGEKLAAAENEVWKRINKE